MTRCYCRNLTLGSDFRALAFITLINLFEANVARYLTRRYKPRHRVPRITTPRSE